MKIYSTKSSHINHKIIFTHFGIGWRNNIQWRIPRKLSYGTVIVNNNSKFSHTLIDAEHERTHKHRGKEPYIVRESVKRVGENNVIFWGFFGYVFFSLPSFANLRKFNSHENFTQRLKFFCCCCCCYMSNDERSASPLFCFVHLAKECENVRQAVWK